MSAYADALRGAAAGLDAWKDMSFWSDGGFETVCTAIAADENALILPPPQLAFDALARTGPDGVRVVILGQDPYPTPGHANGLAFSVNPDVQPLPRSLANIFKELEADIGAAPATGDLSRWADQGVLLLNTALSVRAGAAGSHAGIGWDALIEEIVSELAARDGIVWILWGRHAQAFRPRIEAAGAQDRLMIESAHPSPLSARRGFFGSKPFSRANAHLAERGTAPIDWAA